MRAQRVAMVRVYWLLLLVTFIFTSIDLVGGRVGRPGEEDAGASLVVRQTSKEQEASSRRDESEPAARVLIADDHYLVRGGMRALLEGEPDLAVVAEAQNGQEAVRLSRLHRPDLVLMDVRMPVMDGLQAARTLKEELPRTSVLIVTAHGSQEYLLEAIRAGAAGYILKGAPKHELLEAVRGVLEGEHVLDRRLSTALLRRLAEETERKQELQVGEAAPATSATAGGPQRQTGESPRRGLSGALTPREIDILRLVVAGRTNREIARELTISISTVKTHMQRIISKLRVSDRTQAAVKAVELGLSTE